MTSSDSVISTSMSDVGTPAAAASTSIDPRGIAVQELLGGNIDGDGYRETQVLPCAKLAAHGSDDPAAQIDDQTAVLGDLDESGRRDVAVLRVAPAQQRLDADEPVIVQAEFRLIVQMQLIVLQRAPQTALEVEPILQCGCSSPRYT